MIDVDELIKKRLEGLFLNKYNLAKKEKRALLRINKQNPNYPTYDKAEPVNERDLQIPEVCCAEFGCRKILSCSEKLFGNKCIEHQIKKKLYFHNGKL